MITKEDYISLLNEELSKDIEAFTRDDVFSAFRKFVKNEELLLKAINFGVFHFDYVKYKTLFEGTLFEEGISLFLSLCNEANKKNKDKFTHIRQEYYLKIAKGYASQTQMCWLEGNVLASERNDLIIKQSFQIIGDVIENACKPFVFFLNELRCMVTGKESKQQKLGKAVDALMNFHDIFKGLYKGLLLDISLSQWRNIADHGSYESIENGVRITYGANGEYEKNITKQELILLLHTIDTLYYMHKTAHTLATVEYPGSISVTTSYTKSKEETWNDNVIAQMVETSYSYGLELSEIDKEEGRWNVLLDRKKEIDKNELVQYLSVIVSILEEYEITIKRADKVEYKAWCINGKLSIYKFEV